MKTQKIDKVMKNIKKTTMSTVWLTQKLKNIQKY